MFAATSDHVNAVTADLNCFADRTTTHISGNSSIDTSLIRDIYCSPEVLYETCVAMKFVDDDDGVAENDVRFATFGSLLCFSLLASCLIYTWALPAHPYSM